MYTYPDIITCTGKEWIKQTVVGSLLFPLLISTTVIIINFVAIYYHASRAIPFPTMVRSLGSC